jgi:translation initiation factor 2A
LFPEICVWKVDQPTVKAYVSPLGTYVLTWHYPPRSRPGEPEPLKESWDNLVLWDVRTGAVVWRTQVKNQPESAFWPSIQWTDDERFAARMTTSMVHFYNGRDLGGKEEFNLVVKNVFQFSLVCGASKSKEKEYRVATFVPEKNNTMSDVSVWRVFERAGEKQEMPKKEVTKVFGRGQKVDFLWNSGASSLVIKAFSAVDKSGGSYYGTYDCYYMRVDGSVDVNLRPKREGTIHDVLWDVYGRRFIMVYGAQPASATVYNLKANVVAEFGTGSRNFASFSPSGHLVTLAGFGSLKGAIEVWDNKSVRKVGIAESFAASTFQWAPDSRHFLTAVLQDRMKGERVKSVAPV